eukprot:10163153-Ditylum_brightwellii.AAC.1
MESRCEGLKGTLGVGISLIVLLEVCTKLVADINDICGLIGGGDCAGAFAGGNDQGWLNILLFQCHFLPVKVGNRCLLFSSCLTFVAH